MNSKYQFTSVLKYGKPCVTSSISGIGCARAEFIFELDNLEQWK